MSTQENMDFTTTPRIQSEGWNYGKNTKKRKTSINLDESVGLYLDSKKQETGDFIGTIINKSLKDHFSLQSWIEWIIISLLYQKEYQTFFLTEDLRLDSFFLFFESLYLLILLFYYSIPCSHSLVIHSWVKIL